MAQYARTQTIEHEIGERGTFALRVTSPEIQLRAVPGATVRVRAFFDIRAGSDEEADEIYERVALVVAAADGRLKVSEPRTNGTVGIVGLGRLLGLGSRHTIREISVEMPPEAGLGLQVVSSDVVANGLRSAQRYRTVSGDLVLTDVAGEIELDAVSGEASVRGEGALTLTAKSVSGDISVTAPHLDALRATTVSGDVEVEGELDSSSTHRVETVSGDLLLAPLNGVTLEVRGLSTDVSSSLPHRREGTRDRRRYVIGDGKADVHFSSMSGDVRVEHPRRLSRAAAADHPPAPAAASPSPPPPPSPVTEDERLAILRALERGEIDIDEAARRLSGGE